MLNNNHQNSSCRFAEQVVSYLYGEIDAENKLDFEKHLQNCSSCADELADFAFVRSSINEWRREEFLVLESPAIKIPFLKTADSVETSTVSTEKRSWIAALVERFSLSPMQATAAAAFAVLTICAGLAIWAFNFSGNNEIVDNNKNISASPTVQPNKTVNVADNSDKKQPDKVVSPKQAENENQTTDSDSSKVKPVRIKDSGNKKNASNVDANVPNRKTNDNKNNDNRKKDADKSLPDLAPLTDDEDKTVRLADLFDEIDTK